MFSYICAVVLFFGVASHAQLVHSEQPIEIAEESQNATCVYQNGYFKINGNCDAYIECKNNRPIEQICPDGLHFDVNVKWPSYPCNYPTEVSCPEGSVTQAPEPTAECPHLHGVYPSDDPEVFCGRYKLCVDGKAIEMLCPPGLAFNPANGLCDWPDLVPSCDVEALLKFRCPEVPVNDFTQDLEPATYYKYNGSCYYFLSCKRGRARLLSCDEGLAFDPVSSHCVEADSVNCVDGEVTIK